MICFSEDNVFGRIIRIDGEVVNSFSCKTKEKNEIAKFIFKIFFMLLYFSYSYPHFSLFLIIYFPGCFIPQNSLFIGQVTVKTYIHGNVHKDKIITNVKNIHLQIFCRKNPP